MKKRLYKTAGIIATIMTLGIMGSIDANILPFGAGSLLTIGCVAVILASYSGYNLEVRREENTIHDAE